LQSSFIKASGGFIDKTAHFHAGGAYYSADNHEFCEVKNIDLY